LGHHYYSPDYDCVFHWTLTHSPL